ncbi:MAG TPA: serine/threonine-protein kinase [Polyangiaceae bacterium]|jgi:serine/threonine-protein kinase
MSTPSLPKVGDVIADKYRVDGLLGEGGMAVVFAAHHLLLDKPIAVKLLSPELPRLPQVIERFVTEARAAARVESPHVARVMDVGLLVNGLPYLVMERLDGCDLEELLRLEKRLGIGDAVDYALQALQGLAHAHTLGVVHRDLKPSNLFLAHQPDGTAIVKILDFGIAKVDKAQRKTQQGQAVGSPVYMSPEHIRNDPVIDHRTDIWAMGVVLYELLTGKPPIEEEGVGETLAAVLSKKPLPPSSLRPEIPPALDAAVMRCLEHDVAARFPDVAHVARAIAPFGTGACASLPDAIEQTLRQQLRRYSGSTSFAVRSPAASGAGLAAHHRALATSATQEAPAVTEDSVPELHTGRKKWWLALAVIATAGATYGVLVNAHVIQQWMPGAPPPEVPSASPLPSESADDSASAHAKLAVPSASHHHHSPSAHPHASSSSPPHLLRY